MSGGHFDYAQHRITAVADEIADMIQHNGQTIDLDHYSGPTPYTYPEFEPQTLRKFQQALTTLREASIMVQRIDWLVSGDDGEDTFHRRWNQELATYRLLRVTPNEST